MLDEKPPISLKEVRKIQFQEAVTNLPENKSVLELIEELLAIDIDSPLAKLNETTMSDNNGGRIEL